MSTPRMIGNLPLEDQARALKILEDRYAFEDCGDKYVAQRASGLLWCGHPKSVAHTLPDGRRGQFAVDVCALCQDEESGPTVALLPMNIVVKK